ncbi:hypothetical protein LBMAG42_49160 [Deltaproteobacteria bacterium]|nr:hypothetical protein LBMAG42_49160 [Deltaproteobacteria bacterium]
MAVPAELSFLLGLEGGYAPYGSAAFTPETVCATTRTTSLDPTSEDFGTKETTTCTQAEGWDGAQGEVGSVFPAVVAGLSVDRDRIRLTALFSLGPALAGTTTTGAWALTPDLTLGGDFSLEYVPVNQAFSFAFGALGSLRAVQAHGTHTESGDTRLGSEANFGGGPTLSLGWAEPRLVLRAYGMITTGGELGAGAVFTWSPARLPV